MPTESILPLASHPHPKRRHSWAKTSISLLVLALLLATLALLASVNSPFGLNSIPSQHRVILPSSDVFAEEPNGGRRLVMESIDSSLDASENGTRIIAEAGHKVFLTQEDFRNGTYRITSPGIYTVIEDIDFDPVPESNSFPPPESAQYPLHNGYFLGFFAAISVEADGVVINLMNHTIKQSRAHYLKQRFFAVIELASRPFIANAGPPQFLAISEPIKFATHVVIEDGILGLSSHHGIHGNRNAKVFIKNLVIRDFEVGGISLNGGEEVLVHNVDIGPSIGAVVAPVVPIPLATFSQARFIDHIFNDLLLLDKDLADLAEETLVHFRGRATRSVKHVFDRLQAATRLFMEHYLSGIVDVDIESEEVGPSACPNSGVFAEGRCWYLSDTGATCGDTCSAHGLDFAWWVAEDWTPITPRLLQTPPAQKQSRWARLECYVQEEDRYHTASWDSYARKFGDTGSVKDWSYDNCRLACPCRQTPDPWRLVGNAYCQPYGEYLGDSQTDWLGPTRCKAVCDATASCNYVTYDVHNGKCHLTYQPIMPTRCDRNQNGWSFWKPLKKPWNETELLQEAMQAFHNEQQLPDGSAIYGMLFHKTAPAVHEFGACTDSCKVNVSGATEKKIAVRDARIHDLRVRVDNVVTATSPQGVGVRGPAGDVVQLLRASSCDSECESLNGAWYEGTLLSDAQMALQTLSNAVQAKLGLNASTLFMYFGGTAIPQRVLDWAAGRTMNLGLLFCKSEPECVEALEMEANMRRMSRKSLLASDFGGKKLRRAAAQLVMDRFSLSCGGDAMAHVNKGAVGARFEFLDGVSAAGLHINAVANVGHVEHTLCRSMGGSYIGADARGISVAIAKDVQLNTDITVDSIQADHGEAYGIDVRQATTDISVIADIHNVSGSDGSMEVATRADKFTSGRYTLQKS